MSAPTILIVDDDCAFARSAAQLACAEGCRVQLAGTLRDARDFLVHHRGDLLLIATELPDGPGLDLLEDLDLGRHGQVVLVAAHPSVQSAARAVASPVADYLVKPLATVQLRALLRRTAARCCPDRSERPANAVDALVGNSPAMRELVATLLRVAASDAAVLVLGETGTGKELVARALHEASGCTGPFIAVNCAAVQDAEHARHLFAVRDGHGEGDGRVFERAIGGTLFLDGITDMPRQLQAALLRRLGAPSVPRSGEGPAPARIVAAGASDIAARIADGSLREDLYFRLADVVLAAPPLRERGDDVLLLADLFIRRLNTHYGRARQLAPGTERMLRRHPWPGNVRELQSCVQRAYLLQSGDHLQVRPAQDLQPPAQADEPTPAIVFAVGTTLAELEQRAIAATLEQCGNDKTAAARALGVSVRTIYNHLARAAASGNGPAHS